MSLLLRFIRDDAATTKMEYGIIAVLVSIVLVPAFLLTQAPLQALYVAVLNVLVQVAAAAG